MMDAIAQHLLAECIDHATAEAVLADKPWEGLRKDQLARLQALRLRLEGQTIEEVPA